MRSVPLLVVLCAVCSSANEAKDKKSEIPSTFSFGASTIDPNILNSLTSMVGSDFNKLTSMMGSRINHLTSLLGSDLTHLTSLLHSRDHDDDDDADMNRWNQLTSMLNKGDWDDLKNLASLLGSEMDKFAGQLTSLINQADWDDERNLRERFDLERKFNYTNSRERGFDLRSDTDFPGLLERLKDRVDMGASTDCTADPQSCPLRLRFRYFKQAAQSAPDLNLRVGFGRLVEFNCSTPVTAYVPGKYAVLSRVNFMTAGWRFSPLAQDAATGVWKSEAVFRWKNKTLITVTFSMGQKNFTAGGRVYPPTAAKIDVAITDYPFTSTASCLALHTKLQAPTGSQSFARQRVTQKGTDGQDVTKSPNGGPLGVAFSWLTTVTADGQQIAVLTAPWNGTTCDTDGDAGASATDACRETFFTFAVKNPKNIEWDPDVQPVADVAPFSGAVSQVPFALAILFAVVAALFSF
jgi:hypothetical protein